MADRKGKAPIPDISLDEEGIPLRKDDLPYGGDRMQAMRRMDRPAITLIGKWYAKYHKPEPEIVEEKPVPEIAKPCRNTEDYINNDPWADDNLPNIFITFLHSDETVEGTFCYKLDDLYSLFDVPENHLAAWIIPQQNGYLDDDGYIVVPDAEPDTYDMFAVPSIAEWFVRIPLQRLIERRSFVDNISQHNNENRFIALPIYKTRIGNTEGVYGSSMKHGQAPSETIYYLVPETEYNRSKSGTYTNVFYKVLFTKTMSSRPAGTTLESIREIQQEFPISTPDFKYYVLGRDLDKSFSSVIQNPRSFNMSSRTVRHPVRRALFTEVGEGSEVPNNTPHDDLSVGDLSIGDLSDDEPPVVDPEFEEYPENPEIELYIEEEDSLYDKQAKILDEHARGSSYANANIMHAISELYANGKLLEYDQIVDNTHFDSASFVTQSNLDPQKAHYSNIYEVLDNIDIVVKSFYLNQSSPEGGPTVAGTFVQDIQPYIDEEFHVFSMFVDQVYYLFKRGYTMWVDMGINTNVREYTFMTYDINDEEDTGISYITFASKYWSYTNTVDPISISKWSDIPRLGLTLDRVINTIISTPDIYSEMFMSVNTLYDFDETVNSNNLNINTIVEDIYLGFYILFRAGFKVEREGDTWMGDVIPPGAPEEAEIYMETIEDMFDYTEDNNLEMVFNNHGWFKTLDTLVWWADSDYDFPYGFINNKLNQELAGGKTAVFQNNLESGRLLFMGIFQDVPELYDSDQFIHTTSDNNDLTHTEKIALYLTDEVFREKLGQPNFDVDGILNLLDSENTGSEDEVQEGEEGEEIIEE